jgi:aminoglycoside phosphotransferase (APT) family kinase protein
VRAPGDLIASGRDSDIFEYGPGLVLRRARNGRSMEIEARTMEYVRTHGYPVPAVEEISDDGTDLVMERVDGPSMVEALSKQPWTMRRHGRTLGELHQRLHEIPAPDWLPDAPFGAGDDLLHLDLHPLNVIIGANGPVVIDWPNARRGDGNSDVAVTWIIVAAAGAPISRVKGALLGWGRKVLIKNMLERFDVDAVAAQLDGVVEWKATDKNMTDKEIAAMRALARSFSTQ